MPIIVLYVTVPTGQVGTSRYDKLYANLLSNNVDTGIEEHIGNSR